MIKKVLTICAIMALAASGLHAQERVNNHQLSIFVGGESVPEPTFINLKGKTINTKDNSNKLPWNAGFRFERENMVGEKFGWGWTIGGGLRHTGWNTTIPKGTPNTGRTGLKQTEDYELSISLMGISGEVGFYASFHPVSTFEVFGSLGVSGTLYWEVASKYKSGGYESRASSLYDNISGTLLGPYGLLGVKYTFNEDYFVSLSCRYTRGFSSDNAIKGDLEYAGLYDVKVDAPFTSDLTVMLGVGILFEH